MKQRHAKELAAHDSFEPEKEKKQQDNLIALENLTLYDPEPKEKKLSKAQRKKLKKKQREEEMRKKHEAEAANMTDYKAIENETLKERLAPRGLKVHEVAADGNCLFRACEHQLQLVDDGVDKLDPEKKTHTGLRKLTGTHLAQNGEDYLPYLLKEDGNLMSEEEYKEYCSKIGTTSAWGGQAEIAAISRLLDRQIIVHQAFAEDITMGQKTSLKPLHISFHKHYYTLGAHYNSVIAEGATTDSKDDSKQE